MEQPYRYRLKSERRSVFHRWCRQHTRRSCQRCGTLNQYLKLRSYIKTGNQSDHVLEYGNQDVHDPFHQEPCSLIRPCGYLILPLQDPGVLPGDLRLIPHMAPWSCHLHCGE